MGDLRKKRLGVGRDRKKIPLGLRFVAIGAAKEVGGEQKKERHGEGRNEDKKKFCR